MNNILYLQYALSLCVLTLVIIGLSVLKQRLLRLSAALSRKHREQTQL